MSNRTPPPKNSAVKDRVITGLRLLDLQPKATSRHAEVGPGGQTVAPTSGHKSRPMLLRYTRPRAEERVGRPGEVKARFWPNVNLAQLHSMKDAVRRKLQGPAGNETFREQLLFGINS